ncbi:hypothetical protein [Hyphomicrobium sp. 99]|uniref:hypothetical protein n=1 Tax=Hyphomicrobium sp. 99 TaxID=1163419 RepID=UPI0005F7FC19|nr:hypothetical protein [Hyphomicrobium sp. 99]
MKTLIALAAFAAASFTSSFASAADFGGGYETTDDAYLLEVLPPPVLIATPYNDLYEANGVYYAPPYPLPYFGLFPNWRPRYGAPEVYARARWDGPRGHRHRR